MRSKVSAFGGEGEEEAAISTGFALGVVGEDSAGMVIGYREMIGVDC